LWGTSPGDLRASARLTRAAALALAFGMTTLGILGLADWLYWGEPFHSLRAIVDYTLVQRLSSRGYEAPWHYLTHVTDWSNGLLVVLAVVSLSHGGQRPLAWAVIPVLLLSLLPHKEARYLIATVPFFAIAAAVTLWSWLSDLASDRRHRVPQAALLLVLAVAGSLLYDVSRFRFRRSEDDVRLAWALVGTGQRGIAADQMWRLGGRLYLDDVAPLVDLEPDRSSDAAASRDVFCRPDLRWVVLRADAITDARLRALSDCGFDLEPAHRSTGYRAYGRSAHP
jgi:Alg9-like mannosyltransferase family